MTSDPEVLIERALSLIETRRRPQGTATLSVSLREDGVQAMPDVELVLIQDPLRSGSAALRSGLLGLGDVRGAVGRLTRTNDTISVGRTNADGNITFSGLAEIPHVLWVGLQGFDLGCEGHEYDNELMVIREVIPSGSLLVAAARQPTVEFDVRLPDGSQPDRARIVLRTISEWVGSSWRNLEWTRAGLSFQLHVGHFEVTASSVSADGMDYALPWSDRLEFSVEGRDARPVYRLNLLPVPSVKGRLLFEGERRPTEVFMCEREEIEKLDPLFIEEGWSRKWPDGNLTDAGKRIGLDYVFDVGEEGSYWLFAAEGDNIIAKSPVAFAGSSIRLDLKIPAADGKTQIQVRVLDREGLPVLKPMFNLWVDLEGNYDGTELKPPVQANGTYFLPIPGTAEEYRHLPWIVRVSSDKYAWEEFKVPNPSPGIVAIQLSARGKAELTLKGVGPDVAGSLICELSRQNSKIKEGWEWVSRISYPRGSEQNTVVLNYDGLLPGRYQFECKTYRRLVTNEMGVYKSEFDIRAGVNPIELIGLDLHTVTVEVAGSTVAERGTLFRLSEEADENGLDVVKTSPMTFDGVPKGMYLLRIGESGEKYKFMKFTVDGPTTIRFEGRLPNRLRVIRMSRSLLGFSEGDIILNIDGRACWSVKDAKELLEGLGEREIDILISRKGEVTTLRIQADELLDSCFSWNNETIEWFE